MSLKMKNNIGESRLLSYFRNELDENESADIERWIEASEKNRKMAEQVYRVNFTEAMLTAGSGVDVGNELSLVWRRIRNNSLRRIGTYAQRAAAILSVPLLACTVWLSTELGSVSDEYIEVKSNVGMVTALSLPDKSQVWLNSGSGIRYPSRFTRNNRRVELEGEAFFKVIADAGKKFTVATANGIEVEVLGTEFNMEAYPQEHFVATTLVEGLVNIGYTDGNKLRHNILIYPGQRTVVDCSSMTAATHSANVATEVAWKDGKIIFGDTSLENALRVMGKYFNVDFVVADPKFREYSFTGCFSNSTLEQILEHFYISSKIRSRQLGSGSGGGGEHKTVIELY